jgi:hypothetical protein
MWQHHAQEQIVHLLHVHAINEEQSRLMLKQRTSEIDCKFSFNNPLKQ